MKNMNEIANGCNCSEPIPLSATEGDHEMMNTNLGLENNALITSMLVNQASFFMAKNKLYDNTIKTIKNRLKDHNEGKGYGVNIYNDYHKKEMSNEHRLDVSILVYNGSVNDNTVILNHDDIEFIEDLMGSKASVVYSRSGVKLNFVAEIQDLTEGIYRV